MTDSVFEYGLMREILNNMYKTIFLTEHFQWYEK